jgi:cytochrome bd-type quinol oxidase subunit 2
MRVVGAVAGVNVLRGLPKNRSTIGAALVDTATEVTSAVGIAVTGTILAALFTGSIATSHWSAQQAAQFQAAATISGLVLTVVAAALVGWAFLRMRGAVDDQAGRSEPA